MAWVWTTFGTFALVLVAVTFAASVPVYLSRPRALQNRLLAAVLALTAGAYLGGAALMYLTDDPRSTYAWQVACTTVQVAVPPLYVAFLSTLPSAFARPLARARPALYAVAGLAPIVVLAAPVTFFTGVVPGTVAPWDVAPGVGFRVFSIANAAGGLLGLVVAVSVLRRTRRGTAARAQAIAYLAAFAAFDANNLAYLGYVTVGFVGVLLYTQLALSLVFVLLLAYGFLKTQLFDIDLKVKWTLRRGTMASAFLAVFFVVTAVAEQVLQSYGALVGGVAVGALLFALRPLERAADRLADRAMPRVQDTAEYRTVKKREVYRAAVEGALQDGDVTEKERAMLARLAESLGIGPVEMNDVEREARVAQGATA